MSFKEDSRELLGYKDFAYAFPIPNQHIKEFSHHAWHCIAISMLIFIFIFKMVIKAKNIFTERRLKTAVNLFVLQTGNTKINKIKFES